MNEMLNAVGHNLAQHITSIGVGSGLLLFTFINCMPAHPPTSLEEYWAWVREALQTAIPARYHSTPNPQAPAEPAQK